MVKFNSMKILSFGNIDVNLHMLRLTKLLVTPETPPIKWRETSQLRTIGIHILYC